MESFIQSQPEQQATKKRGGIRVLKWVFGILGILILLVLGYRFLPTPLLDLVSKRVVVEEVGAGGFNNPYRTTFWANGWRVVTDTSRVEEAYNFFNYSVRHIPAKDVSRLESLVSSLDLEKLKQGETCAGPVFDVPQHQLTVSQIGKVVYISADDWFCLSYKGTLKEISAILYK